MPQLRVRFEVAATERDYRTPGSGSAATIARSSRAPASQTGRTRPTPPSRRSPRWLGLTAVVLASAASGCVRQPAPADSGAAIDPAQVHPELWPVTKGGVPLDDEVEARVGELLELMTVAEKVGQVIQADLGSVTPDDVRRYRLGAILSGGNSAPGGKAYARPEEWLATADAFYEASIEDAEDAAAIPIIWGIDAVHGHNNVIGATLFPHNIGLGAARDPDLMRRIGEATAREVRATGQDWSFGPTVAVALDGRWGRTYESYAEDPELVREYAGAIVRGLQGEPGTAEFLGPDRVIATAKHFLGDGGTVGGVDQGDNIDSEAELARVHGAGYVGAIDAGVQAIMASYSSWHGLKMHGNRALLTEILRGPLGFNGFVIGDWNAHGQLAGCTNESCPEALLAGVDMFMAPDSWRALYDNTLAQVEGGEIPMQRLDEAVRRILRIKVRAGLTAAGKPSGRPLAGDLSVIGGADHRALARQAVRRSLVLLKNDGEILPLSPGRRVLVAGDGAVDISKQAGGWTLSWQGAGHPPSDFPGAQSIFDGIREAVEAGGGEAVLATDGRFDGAIPDVAIVVFGEDPYAEFEGDRSHLGYSLDDDSDLQLLRRFKARGVPVVSIFLSGRPLWVNPELNASDAFVAAWLPGSEGGGLADVLFRRPDGTVAHDFAGTLSFSWPRTAVPNANGDGEPGAEPLFAYGYGLRYGAGVELPPLSEDSGISEALLARKGVFLESGGPSPPWQTLTRPDASVASESPGQVASEAGGPLAWQAAEGATTLRWTASEDSWAALIAGDQPVDLRRETNGDMALVLELRLDDPPAGAVRLGVGCGQGCRGDVDVTPQLAAAAGAEWTRLSVMLKCFQAAGADMSRVSAPLILSTAGPAELSLREVRLSQLAAETVVCEG